MRPRERRETGEQYLFRSWLDQIIATNHALVKLARTWSMSMIWSSRERNRSCSPVSRRSRGRIEPSTHHVERQRITA